MINIRQMTSEDIPFVADMEKKIFSMPWSENAFRQALESTNTIYLVAEYENIVVGYCGMYYVMNEADITNVAVDSNYRKNGIAIAMLKEIIAGAKKKGIENVTLEVRESNVPAIKLYEKLGFKESGIRKNFYEKPVENAIIMWKMSI